MKAFPSSAGIQATPKPRFFMKSWNSWLSCAFLSDATILSRISAGMPAGPSTPRQVRMAQSEPDGLLQGRHVRIEREPLVIHLGERARLAGVDQRASLGQRRGDEVDPAGDEILHRGAGALVRHPSRLLRVDLLGQQPADQAEVPDAALPGAGSLEG